MDDIQITVVLIIAVVLLIGVFWLVYFLSTYIYCWCRRSLLQLVCLFKRLRFAIKKVNRVGRVENTAVDVSQEIKGPTYLHASLTADFFTHAHSFALRQEITNLLNNNQKTEHDALNLMRKIATDHTKEVLAILTNWLVSGHATASSAEIAEVQKLSSKSYDEWVEMFGVKNDLDKSIAVATAEYKKANMDYESTSGVFGVNRILAKGDERIKLLEAILSKETLSKRIDELERLIKENDDRVKNYGDEFLHNFCNNLDKMSGVSPLVGKLRDLAQLTAKKLHDEWSRNCQKQMRNLESINTSVLLLSGMYSFEDKS